MTSIRVACIQMNSGPDIDANLKQAENFIREAARGGADFIATPENTDFMRKNSDLTLSTAFDVQSHPGVPFFSALAQELSVWLLIGSMKVKISNNKVVNRSFLFTPAGQLAASYDKIHLFDVKLHGGEEYRESDGVEAGNQAVIVNTSWGKLGMSICYDVRFPNLYRTLAQNGANMLAIPAAFTAQTGIAHWETLLRARAIETGSFVIAPAQCGEHEGGRKTYGHSMIVGPWGQVLAERIDGTPGIIARKIDLLDVVKSRSSIPSLQHDRDFICYRSKDVL